MQKVLVSIGRKTNGIGGMQRLQADLDRALESVSDIHYEIIRPFGTLLDPTFVFRALASCRGATVHLGDASLCFLIPMLRRCGARRIVATACGLDIVYPNFLYQRMIRSFLPRADHVIAISRATAAKAAHAGVHPQKISVIPCGIWPEDLEDSSGMGLVSVARLVPRKGIAWFLEHVFPLIHQEYPNLHWTIVGDGPERKKLERIRSRLGFQKSVSILGRIDEARKHQVLKQNSIFLMPNIAIPHNMEGFGIACIEASAKGLSVTAARLEGIQDAVLEGETGCFFESGNPQDAGNVVLGLLKNPLKPTDVIRITGEKFSWERLVPRYLDIFFPAT